MADLFSPLFCRKIMLEPSKASRIINLLHQKNIPIYNVRMEKKESSFYIRTKYLKLFEIITKRYQSGIIGNERKRLSRFFYLYRKRYGLLFGIALFIFCELFLTKYIWSIDIKGNSNIPENEIREMLARSGIKEGKKIDNKSKMATELMLEANNPEYSYISINYVGTRAEVEIRERNRDELEKEASNDMISNLVAKTSGKIIRFEINEGQTIAKRGDAVEEGELLVSGIVERKNGSYKTVRSKGRVIAETERIFETLVPLEETEKIYTGNESERKCFLFLGKKIFAIGSDKSDGANYEIIEYEEDMTFFGKKLPIRIKHTVYLEYEEKTAIIDVDRARVLAYDRYNEYKRDNIASKAQIISEEDDFSVENDSVCFTFKLKLIEDIAKEKEIYYLPASYSYERNKND